MAIQRLQQTLSLLINYSILYLTVNQKKICYLNKNAEVAITK